MTQFYVASREDVMQAKLAALGLAGPVRRCYLFVERAWNEARRRRDVKGWWVTNRAEATPFLSEDDAWASFDGSGAGSRADYSLEIAQ